MADGASTKFPGYSRERIDDAVVNSPHLLADLPGGRVGFLVETSHGMFEANSVVAATGERELKEYEIDAPEEATLLDCLDIAKDRHDGSLAYRKSFPRPEAIKAIEANRHRLGADVAIISDTGFFTGNLPAITISDERDAILDSGGGILKVIDRFGA